MENREKIVDFKKYCETCEHKDVKEIKDPCNDCLDHPFNTNSHKPINYKEKEKKK